MYSRSPKARWLKRRLVVYSVAAFLAAVFSSSGARAAGGRAQSPPTLAVMNFVNRGTGDGWDWLEKGLADMLITDLHASGKFQVVTRERMQALFDEMALGEAGLLDAKTTQQFGKVLKVDWALFGSVLRKAEQVEIECHIVEVATQKLTRVEWVRGPASSVLKLEKDLALRIVKHFHLPLTPQERASLLRMRTKSVDAATHFYAALDSVDHQNDIKALVQFRQAVKRDPDYHEARLWVARAYMRLREHRHAEVELRRLLRLRDRLERKFHHRVVMMLAHVLELEERYADAVDLYTKVADERLSELLELKAAGKLKPPGTGPPRLGVTGYRRQAEELIIKAYQRTGRVIQPAHGVITLTVEKPEYGDDFSTEKRLWDAIRCDYFEMIARFWPESERGGLITYVSNGDPEASHMCARPGNWRARYIFKAKDGYLIDAITVELTGIVHTRPKRPFRTNPVFGCQVWNLARTLDYTRFPFNGAFWDTNKTTRRFTVTFPEGRDAIETVLKARNATLFDWKISATLSPSVAGPGKVGTLAVTSEPVRVFVRLDDGDLIGRAPIVKTNVPVGVHKVSGSLGTSVEMVIPETGEVYRARARLTVPVQKVTIKEGERTDVTLHVDVQVQDDRGGREFKHMHWTKAVTSPRSLKVHGCSLMQDADQTFWLVWSWGRARKEDRGDCYLWISSSADGLTWKQPRKLAVDPPGDDIKPRMVQRPDGTYRLVWINGGEVYVSGSRDAVRWAPPMKAASLPVTRAGGGNPFPLIDRRGTHHVLKRTDNLKFCHAMSTDGQRWTRWRTVSTQEERHKRGMSWPEILSALQDADGVFWFAVKAAAPRGPGDTREKLGNIWLARVKRFDKWGLVAE